MKGQQLLGNVVHFSYVVSKVTNDARCSREIKTRIAMAKAAFNKKNIFTSKLLSNLKKKLAKCYILSIVLCGVETWTLRDVDQKLLLFIRLCDVSTSSCAH
jgi:hypothetical protein